VLFNQVSNVLSVSFDKGFKFCLIHVSTNTPNSGGILNSIFLQNLYMEPKMTVSVCLGFGWGRQAPRTWHPKEARTVGRSEQLVIPVILKVGSISRVLPLTMNVLLINCGMATSL
jgi:hypothetical protein